MQVLPGIAACRVDAPMYFANVQYIHERLRKYVDRAAAYSEAAGVQLQYLLLDMSPVTHLDSTGANLLEKLHEEMRDQGIQLGLCNPGAAVINLLERTSFPNTLGREWIFVRMHDAVQRCLAQMIAQGHTVKPTSAIHSAAMSPKHAEALRNSPTGRHSSLGGPEDTEIGVSHVDLGLAFRSPFADAAAGCSAAQPLISSPIVGHVGSAVDSPEGATAAALHADPAAQTASGVLFSQPMPSWSTANSNLQPSQLVSSTSSLQVSQVHRAGYQRLSGTPQGAGALHHSGSSHRHHSAGGSGSSGVQPFGEVLFSADGSATVEHSFRPSVTRGL
eukprot:GHUV01034614.1.p1 GENE.GHUV01034614.1~~GHUV01034614.1.p1  ORF type:complete len:332 (+),score=86.74 GHUV01034614.1:840-1835(+)